MNAVLGLAVLAAAMWTGTSLLRIAGVRMPAEERLVVGPVLGIATVFFLVYTVSSSIGFIGTSVLVAVLALAGLTSIAARARPRPPDGPVSTWFWLVGAATTVVFTALALWGVMAPDGSGAIVASEHVWADTPFHAAQVTSFGYRDNFPPTYTIALDAPLNYPFLVNFVSGVLLKTGLPLRASMVIVAVVLQVLFFLGVAVLARRLTGSRAAATVAVGLLFFLGNLGILAVPVDVSEAGGLLSWIRDVPWSYTGDALGDPGRDRLGIGLYLGNPVYIYLLPERSSAFGLAAIVALALLLDELRRRPATGVAAVTGVLLGTMPRIHAHGTLMVLFVAGVWFVLDPVFEPTRTRETVVGAYRRAFPAWALAGLVAAIVALPHAEALSRQSEGFFSLWPGWIGESHEALTGAADGLPQAAAMLGGFWFLNAGILLPLAFLGWAAAGRSLRLFYVPFALAFVLANVVKTQPWEWDNNNFFFYWQVATVILVAPPIASMLRPAAGRGGDAAPSGDPGRGPPRTSPAEGRRRLASRVGGVVLVLLLTAGGALSHLYWLQTRYHLWSDADVAFAEFVREATPKDALVVTSNGHTHPVLALSGRRGVMGFPGWIYVHNLDWRGLEDDLVAIYKGDMETVRRLGADYVVVGSWERSFAGDHGFDLSPALDDPALFEVVHTADVGGQEWRLLQVRVSG